MDLKRFFSICVLMAFTACATVTPSQQTTYKSSFDDKDIKPFVESPVLPDIDDTVSLFDKIQETPQAKPDTVKRGEEIVEKDHRIPQDAVMTGAIYDKPYVIRGETYHRLKYVETFEQTGIASWYGGVDHGKDTSNGETYDMYAMTAAHKNLPMDSMVEVTNVSNGKKVTVRINDRGPHVEGRVIDLSKKAADKIGIKDKGLGKVYVKLLAPAGEKNKDDLASDSAHMLYAGTLKALFAVQLASFTDKNHADALAESFKNGKVERANIKGTTYYRVKVGGFSDKETAEGYKTKIASRYPKAFVVTE